MSGYEEPGARVHDSTESTVVGGAAGAGQLPSLDELLGGANTLTGALLRLLGRQWDPTSGPGHNDEPHGPAAMDRHLAAAVADIRSAQQSLQRLGLLLHPPSGSIEPVDHPA